MTDIIEKPWLSGRQVVYIVLIIAGFVGQYKANQYNTEIMLSELKNELKSNTEKVYIYIDQLQESNGLQNRRIESNTLGLRKLELDMAEAKSRR